MQAKIIKLRVSTAAAQTRLVFDLTAPVHFKLTSCTNQIAILLEKTTIAKDAINPHISFCHTPIRYITTSWCNNVAKINIALRSKVATKTLLLDHPSRLVVDLQSDNISKEKPTSVPVGDNTQDKVQQMIATEINTLAPPENNTLAEEPLKQEAVKKSEVTTVSPPVNAEPVLVDTATKSDEQVHKYRPIIVAIDPGHGGKDPGAIGRHGTREKDVVFGVAKSLEHMINNTPGFHAVLTRKGDYFISLRERLNIAHEDKADMFIAIHADAYKYSDSRGASVFALSQRGATSEKARWIAEQENESELGQAMSDKSTLLRSVLVEMAQTATVGASLEIGDNILHRLSTISELHCSHVEQAAFVVLKSPDIPSLLVETGFVSDSHEEALLRTSAYQAKLASALALGIENYFRRQPPPGTYLASLKHHGLNYATY